MTSPITSYFEQLRQMARRLGSEDPERTLRLAFTAAGVPSSTYYRARCGTDLRAETADKVASVLHRMGTVTHGRSAPAAAASAL